MPVLVCRHRLERENAGGTRRYTLFDTDFGTCGIVWTARGVSGFNFPEASPADTEARLRRIADPADVVPDEIDEAIVLLQRYFGGEPVDLRGYASTSPA